MHYVINLPRYIKIIWQNNTEGDNKHELTVPLLLLLMLRSGKK